MFSRKKIKKISHIIDIILLCAPINFAVLLYIAIKADPNGNTLPGAILMLLACFFMLRTFGLIGKTFDLFLAYTNAPSWLLYFFAPHPPYHSYLAKIPTNKWKRLFKFYTYCWGYHGKRFPHYRYVRSYQEIPPFWYVVQKNKDYIVIEETCLCSQFLLSFFKNY